MLPSGTWLSYSTVFFRLMHKDSAADAFLAKDCVRPTTRKLLLTSVVAQQVAKRTLIVLVILRIGGGKGSLKRPHFSCMNDDETTQEQQLWSFAKEISEHSCNTEGSSSGIFQRHLLFVLCIRYVDVIYCTTWFLFLQRQQGTTYTGEEFEREA
jgi:hypothetical protein